MIKLKNQDFSIAGKIKLLSDIIEQRTAEYEQLIKETAKKAKLIQGYKTLLAQLDLTINE